MATFSKYFKILLKHEGKYVDDPHDKGGPTSMGVTLAVWVKNGYDKDCDGDIDKYDLKKITELDAENIARKLYWDKIGGDLINSQALAELLFDFAYNSGVTKAVSKIQRLLPANIKADGVMGKMTLTAINSQDARTLFNRLWKSREDFYNAIVRANPSQKKFLKGWMNRLKSFKWLPN